MKRVLATGTAALVVGLGAGVVMAQQQPAPPPRPYYVGNPIGVPAAPPAPTATNPAPFVAMSPNVKVYGGFRSAEACQYDPGMDLVVVTNMGIGQNLTPNDAWITLLNHDGSVHTPKWIGVQGAGNARGAAMETPLVLNQPFGIDIVNGTIYVADRDGGIADTANPGQNTPSVAVVRMFDAVTGAPTGEVQVPGSTGLNDLAVAADGTIYGTNTGGGGQTPDPTTWVIWKIAPDGTVSQFAVGEPMRQPNGVAIDNDGNIVVVNIGSPDVITFAPDGTVVRTEQAVQPGNDGLVIMADGTKYVSSVTMGGVSMIPAGGGAATLIAEGIPSAASMCYDPTANALFIPMNNNNAVAIVPLD